MRDRSANASKVRPAKRLEPNVLYMHPTYSRACYEALDAIEVHGVRFVRDRAVTVDAAVAEAQSRADMYRRQLGGTNKALERERQRVRDLERELAGRECEVDNTIQWQWAGPTTYYEYELSCGHVITSVDNEPPNYCEECGARVKGGAE